MAALAPAEPGHVAAIPVQDRLPIKGCIMTKDEDEYAPGKALARMTEWPKRAPKSFSIVCYVHGSSRCKGIWPSSRAPAIERLVEWARRAPGLSRADRFRCLPA